MKSIKDIWQLVRTELIICVAIPILTAILLSTDWGQTRNYFLMIIMGLFCVFAYGMIKMFFTFKKHDANFSEITIGKIKLGNPKSTPYRIFILIGAVLMPIAGLVVNNGSAFSWGNGGVFGDFSSIWFYVIAAINGLVMLADIKDNKRSLLLFYLKIAGFTYIAYFTIIFIPIMPYAFPGILFFGLGILILVPALVFAVELLQILQDISILKTKFKALVTVVVLFGLITIPAALAISFSLDKINFQRALTYLAADSQEMPAVSIKRLNTALDQINGLTETGRTSRGLLNGGSNIPIITKFYQIVALDDKMLSPETSQRLGRIFGGTDSDLLSDTFNNPVQNGRLLNAKTSTEFDETLGVSKTWVDLEIKNGSESSLAEYRTEFLLPDGCFIKDYYLNVGGERKQGLLADKRAALITYTNIIRTPKDPGIIYYKSDNIIELRVYPFEANQVRQTGFLVWHSQNEILTIDGKDIDLAATKPLTEPLVMQGISFIPASYKTSLRARGRVPQYYFIVDASKNSPYKEHLRKVSEYINNSSIENPKIYAASYKVYAEAPTAIKREGGFNLPLAMEMIFKEHEGSELDFPVIIAVSDNINNTPELLKSSLAKQFPESEYYYNLGYDLSLTPYSFRDNNRHDLVQTPVIAKTRAYNGIFVADNGKSEMVINGTTGGYTNNEYQNAFILQAKSSANNNDDKRQIELVRDSFRQRVLTKYTSFTVLETKEQENFLLDLQAEFLNSDEDESPAVMMDEPGLLVCLLSGLLLMCAVVLCRKNKCGV